MDAFAQGGLWPPKVGDYARVRRSGLLGEVVRIARTGAAPRFAVNVFAAGPATEAEYRLDELTPAWPVNWTRTPIQ